MNNRLISTLVKQVSPVIGWLGGGLVGVTAILSALGYLVIRSHYDLLGITGFVPMSPEAWSIEGARFIYNSLLHLVGAFFTFGWVFFLVIASVVLSIITAKWAGRIHAITKHPLAKASIILLSFIGLSIAISMFGMKSQASHLLVEPLITDDTFSRFDDALIMRSDKAGITKLRMKYALLESMLLFLFVWLRLFQHMPNTPKAANGETQKTPSSSPWIFHWYQVTWFLFMILVLLLPMNYGKMARSNQFFKVRLIKQLEDPDQFTAAQASSNYEGWLLHKDAKEIVLYTRTPATQQFHILGRSQFAHIHTVAFGNIFSE